MQNEATLEELVSQLASSPVAFGTENPVNAELGPALEVALADAGNDSFDPAGMIVLEQTPPVIADLRDLAQDTAAETGLDTVLVLSLIHISEPTRHFKRSRMPSSA